jgi:hypothetical protein
MDRGASPLDVLPNVRFWVTADIRCYMLQVQI